MVMSSMGRLTGFGRKRKNDEEFVDLNIATNNEMKYIPQSEHDAPKYGGLCLRSVGLSSLKFG